MALNDMIMHRSILRMQKLQLMCIKYCFTYMYGYMHCSVVIFMHICLLLNTAVARENTCHKTASLQRSISQNGFHRILHTKIRVPWNLTGCLLLLEEKFPAGVFVDPDELVRVSDEEHDDKENHNGVFYNHRQHHVHCVLGKVDIEAFEPNSSPLKVYTYTAPFCLDQKEVELSLPLHLRYHSPNSGGVATEVALIQPSLLASCPYTPGEATRSCPGWSEGPAPCTYCSRELCDWIHLPYSSAQLELRISVPVGNKDHGPFVVAITALTLLLTTLFLLWTIQTSAKKNR